MGGMFSKPKTPKVKPPPPPPNAPSMADANTQAAGQAAMQETSPYETFIGTGPSGLKRKVTAQS